MSYEDRAKSIDLGDGTFCCDRAMGGICYEHSRIAASIRAAVACAVHDKWASMAPGRVLMELNEHTTPLDRFIRRYTDDYTGIDTGWGFWDEAQLYFHGGYATPEEASRGMVEYARHL